MTGFRDVPIEALRNLELVPGDITLIPPDTYSKDTADRIYVPAFGNAMNFVHLQGITGGVVEFGVHNGYTARLWAEMMLVLERNESLYLFDSFAGMPATDCSIDRSSYEYRRGDWLPGTTKPAKPDAPQMIKLALSTLLDKDRVIVVQGWFNDTMSQLPKEPPAIVHIDCDLYESTVTVLKALRERELLQQGQIFMFDDWNSGRASNFHGERAAVRDHGKEHFEPWFAYGWHGQSFIYQMR